MKKRTLNEYRQTKEYQGSSEGRKYLDDLESYGMDQLEKKEKLEKLDKEITKVFSPHKLNDAAKAKLHEFKDVEFDDFETPKEIKKIQKEITLNEQIEDIAERVKNRIHDVLFNEIFEIMDYYDELNWGHFVQDDAPEALLDACMDHKQGIHYEIFQLVLKKLK